MNEISAAASHLHGNRARTALLLMDFHSVVVAWHGEAGRDAVAMAARALYAARRVAMPIFHALPHHRHGYPESPAGEPFDAVKAAGLFSEAVLGAGIDPQLAPNNDEPLVAKCRYSPFYANDLLHLLRVRGIRSLALAGLSTSGVVLSAVRDAWDGDYDITVLEDACADPNAEVHRVLLSHIFPPQAKVMSVADWIATGPPSM